MKDLKQNWLNWKSKTSIMKWNLRKSKLNWKKCMKKRSPIKIKNLKRNLSLQKKRPSWSTKACRTNKSAWFAIVVWSLIGIRNKVKVSISCHVLILSSIPTVFSNGWTKILDAHTANKKLKSTRIMFRIDKIKLNN